VGCHLLGLPPFGVPHQPRFNPVELLMAVFVVELAEGNRIQANAQPQDSRFVLTIRGRYHFSPTHELTKAGQFNLVEDAGNHPAILKARLTLTIMEMINPPAISPNIR